jgi:SNF2 family DNA or RNA helicase
MPELPKPPTAPDLNKLLTNNPNLDIEQIIEDYQQALATWRTLLGKAERDLYEYKLKYQEHKNYVPRPNIRREYVPINDERALGKYMFGRSYEEVGLELPRLIENKRIVTLNPEREREYKEMRLAWASHIKSDPDFIINAANSMKAMHLLRMLASCDTKMEACFDIIEETPGPHLIYTVYDASSAEPLYALLNAKLRHTLGENAVQCITGTRYPGSIGASKRSSILTAPTTDIAVCTMSSVGKGLNLQRFNTVIFYEGDWTPGIMYQALTRVHRARKEADTRQTPVLAYYLLSKGTIDEGIHAKRNSRTNAAKDILKIELSRA